MKYLLKVLSYILFNACYIVFALHFIQDSLIIKFTIAYILFVSALILIPDNYYITESIIPDVIPEYNADKEAMQWMTISTLIS